MSKVYRNTAMLLVITGLASYASAQPIMDKPDAPRMQGSDMRAFVAGKPSATPIHTPSGYVMRLGDGAWQPPAPHAAKPQPKRVIFL